MIQEVFDEILDDNPKYTFRDEDGNVLNDNVDITLKTPVIQEGTPINGALLKNLQGDLYTQDRYNLPETRIVEYAIDFTQWTRYSVAAQLGDINMSDMIYAKGMFVAVGTSGLVATSTDGITWSKQTISTSINFKKIIYANDMFVIIANTNSAIYASTDAINWERKSAPSSSTGYTIAYGNGIYVIGAGNGVIMTSTDLVTWTSRTSGVTSTINDITFGDGKFAVATNAAILTSADGITWEKLSITGSWNKIKYLNNIFLVGGGGTSNAALKSSDGIVWNPIEITLATTGYIANFDYANGKYLTTRSVGEIYWSDDAEIWQKGFTTSYKQEINAIANDGNKFVAISNDVDNAAYITETYKPGITHLNLDNIPLTSYEKGKIVNIQGGKAAMPNKKIPIVGAYATSVYSDQYLAEYGTDESEDTFWMGANSFSSEDATTVHDRWYIELGNAVTAKVMTLKLGDNIEKFSIQGSSDGVYWTNLYDYSGLTTNDAVEYHFPNSTAYKYYGIAFYGRKSQGRAAVYEAFLSSAVSESFEKPQLNINNLGTKQINGIINYGRNYNLIYNGESWDIFNSQVVSGSFSHNGMSKIYLPFTPDLVIGYNDDNNSSGIGGSGTGTVDGLDVPRILTKVYSHENGYIFENGFAYGTAVAGKVNYIAIKF